jgi:hypothetical protein
MQSDELIHRGALIVVEFAANDQEIRNRSRPISTPRAESADELILIDEPTLERKQAEEEVAIGFGM